MSLASERAAIGAGITSTRAPAAGAERRATGQRIVAERRGESVVEDLNRLQRPARTVRTLRSVPSVGGVPALRGRGSYVAPPPATGGGGIASPLEEQDYGARTFHAMRYLETSDGIFTFELGPPNKIVMTDANSVNHDFNYANPT